VHITRSPTDGRPGTARPQRPVALVCWWYTIQTVAVINDMPRAVSVAVLGDLTQSTGKTMSFDTRHCHTAVQLIKWRRSVVDVRRWTTPI